MAELAFVDTHFHLHDMKHPTLRYGWLEPDAVHGFLPDTDPLSRQLDGAARADDARGR